MAFLMAASPQTTGCTSRPVMNLMSSIAKMLLGLAIATVRTRPSRRSGRTWNLVATSAGIRVRHSFPTSIFSRLTTGRL